RGRASAGPGGRVRPRRARRPTPRRGSRRRRRPRRCGPSDAPAVEGAAANRVAVPRVLVDEDVTPDLARALRERGHFLRPIEMTGTPVVAPKTRTLPPASTLPRIELPTDPVKAPSEAT